MRAHVFILFFTCLIYESVALAVGNSSESLPLKNNTKIHIDIYYESLCPDSMDFVINQFAPAYESLKNHIDVLFVPFGKSESEENGKIFFCQHGPAECTGNRMQSCVLDALANDQDSKSKFVSCQMKYRAEYTGERCATAVNVSFDNVQKCTEGARGVELQLAAEKQTHTIRKPYPSYVPTIVYNKQYNSSKQWRSLREFKSLVCDELKAVSKPDELPSACV